jgi:hypothetical protein
MAEILKKDENEEFVTLNITNDAPEKEVKIKEYQKLLFADEARLKVVKVKELIRLGCFEQYQTKGDEINFNELKKIEYAQKYKNHELYENVTTHGMFYIQTLDEEDKEGNKKIYGYDVVEIDIVDDETYKKLLNAHKHENNVFLNVIYTLAWVFICVSFISVLFASINLTITNQTNYLVSLLQTCATPLGVFGLSLSTLVLATIAKKNHDDKE